MDVNEIFEYVDEFLRDQEDVLHGKDRNRCSKSRKYLNDLKQHFFNL